MKEKVNVKEKGTISELWSNLKSWLEPDYVYSSDEDNNEIKIDDFQMSPEMLRILNNGTAKADELVDTLSGYEQPKKEINIRRKHTSSKEETREQTVEVAENLEKEPEERTR